LAHRFAQKRFGRGYIAVAAHIEIHGLAGLVHGSVPIPPGALHLEVGFVTPPATNHPPGIAVPALLAISSIVLDPAQNRGVHCNATLSHHGHQISINQFVAELQRTHNTTISGSKCRPLNSSSNVYEPWCVSIIAAPVERGRLPRAKSKIRILTRPVL
jgi:hypothetical protein